MAAICEIVDWYRARGNRVILSDETSEQLISAPKAISSATVEHLSFINGKFTSQCNELIQSAKCKLILLDEVLEPSLGELPSNISFIFSQNPKEDVVAFCKKFLNFEQELTSTVIYSSAIISEDVEFSGFVKIDSGVVIEENVKIGKNVKIGANTIIHANTIIGNNVDVGANNVIGGVGFGYAQNADTKEYEQFPHYGSVIIHNDVSIGNNTCIDRGSLSDTIIHDGVKIDNLVHIAHNVQIGKNSLIIAHAMIAGSVTIGENCWIAPSSCIRNGISIGNNVTVGLASTVVKSIADGQTVMGSPAIDISKFKKLRAVQSRMTKED